MASDLPRLQVSKCLWESGQPGALLWRCPHHQERPRQPLLCRQLQVRGSCHWERRRRFFHCYTCIPGNWHRSTLDLLFVVVSSCVKKDICGGCFSSLLHAQVFEKICEFAALEKNALRVFQLWQRPNFPISLVNDCSSGDLQWVKAFRMLKCVCLGSRPDYCGFSHFRAQ